MNRVALVTGASRGIGRGIALALAALGYDLLLSYRSQEAAMSQTTASCLAAARSSDVRIRVEQARGDLAVPQIRAELIDHARRSFGRLDLLVNNAGIAPRERVDLLQTTEESFDEVLATNLKVPFFLTQTAARFMIDCQKRLELDRQKIITISSLSAYTASINRGEYCISKAGLSMVTRLFAVALAPYNIGVFEIRPGIIATDMTAGVKDKYDTLIAHGLTPITRWGEPEDVAKAVSAIAQDLFPFSTGEVINVDGGFHLPRL